MKNGVVVTGLGVVSAVGSGCDDFWNSLMAGHGGAGYIDSVHLSPEKSAMGAVVGDFAPKDYIKPKKNIKLMSRDIQLGFVAAAQACRAAGIGMENENKAVEPERLGVIFGCDLISLELDELVSAFRAGQQESGYDFSTWGAASMAQVMPLWMLKYLPNMPACHIGIALDSRGPNNTLTLERASMLASVMEAVGVIERGDADIMVCGGCGNKASVTQLIHAPVHRTAPDDGNPQHLLRPFDRDRCGTISGEGAGAIVLEREEFAKARGAEILARFVAGSISTIPSRMIGANQEVIEKNIGKLLKKAGRTVADLGHVNAEGLGVVQDDAAEAAAIRKTLGDVPVFGAKGYVGVLGAGSGAIELVASLLALKEGMVPATKNCNHPADDCPINVIMEKPQLIAKRSFAKLSHTNRGRAFAAWFES